MMWLYSYICDTHAHGTGGSPRQRSFALPLLLPTHPRAALDLLRVLLSDDGQRADGSRLEVERLRCDRRLDELLKHWNDAGRMTLGLCEEGKRWARLSWLSHSKQHECHAGNLPCLHSVSLSTSHLQAASPSLLCTDHGGGNVDYESDLGLGKGGRRAGRPDELLAEDSSKQRARLAGIQLAGKGRERASKNESGRTS